MTDEAASGASGPIDWSGPGGPDRGEATEGDAPATNEVVGENPSASAPSTEGTVSPDPGGDTAGADVGSEGDLTLDADDGVEPLDTAASAAGEAAPDAERDEYLDRLQRLQAEFENYRKRMTREQTEAAGRGSQALAAELLPVLDGCDAAVQQGLVDVEPIRHQLVEILTKAGLEQNGALGDPFDPECHDAVMHEPADDPADESTIAEVLRTGYSWKGRVIRPAMVKVKG